MVDENRLMMKGRLDELRRERKKQEARGKLLLRQIAMDLNPALRDIEEMDVAAAAQAMDELIMTQAELLGIRNRITDLEEALYG